MINYAFVKGHTMEYGCNITGDETETQFILINLVINTGILTLSGGNGEETKVGNCYTY